MKFKLILLLISVIGFIGCSEDTDTPIEKRSSSYLQKPLQAFGAQKLSCKTIQVILPASIAGQTLERYILDLQLANREMPLSRLSVSELQEVYTTCIRPALIERL